MFAGNEPPTPAASDWTLTAAAFVALYQRLRTLGLLPEMTPVVSSRSSSRACTRPVTCCPRLASCDTRPNPAALSTVADTRRPPKTRPMTSANTITAINRHDTGQFPKVSAGELRYCRTVEFLARLLLSAACTLPPATVPWLPIAYVLAGYAPLSSHSLPKELTRPGGTPGPAASPPGAPGLPPL